MEGGASLARASQQPPRLRHTKLSPTDGVTVFEADNLWTCGMKCAAGISVRRWQIRASEASSESGSAASNCTRSSGVNTLLIKRPPPAAGTRKKLCCGKSCSHAIFHWLFFSTRRAICFALGACLVPASFSETYYCKETCCNFLRASKHKMILK